MVRYFVLISNSRFPCYLQCFVAIRFPYNRYKEHNFFSHSDNMIGYLLHKTATLNYLGQLYLGQLSRHLLQPPVTSSTDVGETQTRYRSAATLNGLNQY